MEDPRCPVGPFEMEIAVAHEKRRQFIEEFARMPVKLRESVKRFSPSQLDIPCRLGGSPGP